MEQATWKGQVRSGLLTEFPLQQTFRSWVATLTPQDPKGFQFNRSFWPKAKTFGKDEMLLYFAVPEGLANGTPIEFGADRVNKHDPRRRFRSRAYGVVSGSFEDTLELALTETHLEAFAFQKQWALNASTKVAGKATRSVRQLPPVGLPITPATNGADKCGKWAAMTQAAADALRKGQKSVALSILIQVGNEIRNG